jgi:hypothetical protein
MKAELEERTVEQIIIGLNPDTSFEDHFLSEVFKTYNKVSFEAVIEKGEHSPIVIRLKDKAFLGDK